MVSAAAEADPPDYDRARAVARYDGVMRELVHDLKFRDRHDARRVFGRWLVDAGSALLADAHLVIPVPPAHPAIQPLLLAVPLQLLTYHLAVLKGCDVDQPRNLAKSVTVE